MTAVRLKDDSDFNKAKYRPRTKIVACDAFTFAFRH